MIFDAHTDVLFDIIEKHNSLNYHLQEMKYYKGALLNYYFKGNESYSSFLFVLNKIKEFYHQNYQLLYKKNMILGIEGLGPITSEFDVNYLVDAGIKCITLTWNDENILATGTYCNKSHGLKNKGKEFLKLLESKNILLDLSHLNEKSFFDVINNYHGAMIVSHSNVKYLKENERNLSKEQLEIIKQKQILVGVNSYKNFVGQNEDLESFVNIIDYLKKEIGIDLICLGLDFDYYLKSTSVSGAITNLKTPKDIVKLKKCLRERNYSDKEIQKIFYENIITFLKKNKILC